MRIASYDEWFEAKCRQGVDLSEESLVVDCSRCDGSGEIEDCGQVTGRYFYTECPGCDGEGKVESDFVSSSDPQVLRRVFSFQRYTEELRGDLSALSEWVGRGVAQVLFDAGFKIWSDLETKKLQSLLPVHSVTTQREIRLR